MKAPASRILTGQKDLDKKLAELAVGSANRAARAGLVKGARLAAKLIKKQIPSKYKGIRGAIGHSVKKSKAGVTTAKAGAAVGKRSKKGPPKRSSKGGVGIRAANIHWFLLGTEERTQDTTGRGTGAMPAFPAVKQAMSGGSTQVLAAIKEGTQKQLTREIAKLARKKAIAAGARLPGRR